MRVGILISGRGSNLQALLQACAAADFPAEIVLVVSNKAAAGGLVHAKAAGVETKVIDHRDFETREDFDAAWDAVMNQAKVDFICLAGFMRLLSDRFVNIWRGRLINIHPSLLPAFKGLHVHERAVEAGVRISGCTVHYVHTTLDSGPIIAQAAVPVLPDDDAKTLAARILLAEHRLYPMALRLIASGKARMQGSTVMVDVDSDGAVQEAMFNPKV